MTFIARRNRVQRLFGSIAAGAAMLAMAGCKDLDIENLNGASAEGLATAPTAPVLIAASQQLVNSWRSIDLSKATNLTKYGYERWAFRASEPRGLTDVVASPISGGYWSFSTIKNIQLLLDALPSTAGLTAGQVAGLRAWLKLNMAIQYQDMAVAHDSFGIVLDLPADPLVDIPAIATKAAAWTKIYQLMDESYADMGIAGAVFPQRMSTGFAGFNTPATMRPLNRALKARWQAQQAIPIGKPGYDAAAWNAALATLNTSFINVPAGTITAAQLRSGPFHTFDGTTGNTNSLSNADSYSHERILVEAQCKVAVGAGTPATCAADATATNRDGRAYGANAKLRRLTTAQEATLLTVTARYRLTDFLAPIPTANIGLTASMPVIRNEELILLRAEINYNLGNNSAAIADINKVRTGAIANLDPISDPYVGNAALNQPASLLGELLYEKRLSLWGEQGTVWLDMRHYGIAHLIPHQDPTFRIFDVFPFPTAECDVRGYNTRGCFQGGYPGIQGGPNLLSQPLTGI